MVPGNSLPHVPSDGYPKAGLQDKTGIWGLERDNRPLFYIPMTHLRREHKFPGLWQGVQAAVLPKGASIKQDGNFLCLPPTLPALGKKAFPPPLPSQPLQQVCEVCPADLHMEF